MSKSGKIRPYDMRGKPLTQRQAEVMDLVVAGKNNVEIRAILGINLTTIKNHLQYAYRKLDAYGRVLAAVRWDRLKRTQ